MNFDELILCDLMEKADGECYPKIMGLLFDNHLKGRLALFRLVHEGVISIDVYNEFNNFSIKGLDLVFDSVKDYLRNED